MSILIDKNTRIMVQGITGSQGSLHTKLSQEYAETKIVAGVTPGKGGTTHLGVPVYNFVSDATNAGKIDCSMIFVPPAFCLDAILESIAAEIPLIIVITEGIPVYDMSIVASALKGSKSRLIGPNCPGVITPGQVKIGIMPGAIFKAGPVGVISRSGTLTYETVDQLTKLGLGQSTCVGIGGDPVAGSSFIDILKLFNEDDATKAITLIGEIGGSAEEEAADYIAAHVKKPVAAFISGQTAPAGRRMGHAGAIISGGKGDAKSKMDYLLKKGLAVAKSPATIGETLKSIYKA